MFKDEAKIIYRMCKDYEKKKILNICNYNEDFYKIMQPYIWNYLLKPLKEKNEVINLDLKKSKGVDIVVDCCDMEAIEGDSYDVVLFNSGIEHITTPHKVLSEIKRVLKEEGEVIFSAPGVYPYHEDPIDTLLRLPDKKSWENILMNDWKIIEYSETEKRKAKKCYDFDDLVYATIIKCKPIVINISKEFYDNFSIKLFSDYIRGNKRIESALRFTLSQIPNKTEKILDIGCGIGWSTNELKRHYPEAEVIGIDMGEKNIEVAKNLFNMERLNYYCINILDKNLVKIKNRKFEVLVLLDVYEHIEKEKRNITHNLFKELLSDEGTLILTCPTVLHQNFLRKYNPEGIQPVDEDITLDVINQLAKDIEGELIYLNYFTIWNKNDYLYFTIKKNPKYVNKNQLANNININIELEKRYIRENRVINKFGGVLDSDGIEIIEKLGLKRKEIVQKYELKIQKELYNKTIEMYKKAQNQLNNTKNQLNNTKSQLNNTKNQLNIIINSKAYRLSRMFVDDFIKGSFKKKIKFVGKIFKGVFKKIFKRKPSKKKTQLNKSLKQYNFLIKNKKKYKYHILIYADVSLNIIDGSSVWLILVTQLLAMKENVYIHLLVRNTLKRDILVSELYKYNNIRIIDPYKDFKKSGAGITQNKIREWSLTPLEASILIKKLDKVVNYDLCFIRGYEISYQIVKNTKLARKTIIYLLSTFFHRGDTITDRELNNLKNITTKNKIIICQTQEIKNYIVNTLNVDSNKIITLYPIISDFKCEIKEFKNRNNNLIYVGKFAKLWYSKEILNAFNKLRERYKDVKFHIAGDKFNSDPDNPNFKEEITELLETTENVIWYKGIARNEVERLISDCDIGISWRHPEIDNSLEISTKLLEYGSKGKPVIMNRNMMHEKIFGKDYPLFANSEEEFIEKVILALTNIEIYETSAKRVFEISKSFTFSQQVKNFLPKIYKNFNINNKD